MSVFIVIPAFNEEKNIPIVLKDIFSLYPNFKIVVVDDGSTDGTFNAAKESGAIVLRHVINRGQGAALKTGTDYALHQDADVVVHFDSDRQFEPKEISLMIEPILKGETAAVLGSRFLSQKNNLPWTKKKIILPLARVINFLFTGCWLSDAHNGFRALSRPMAELLDLKQDRMAHNSEIIRLIKRNKVPFQEKGVTVYYYRYGQNWQGGFKIIKDLIIGNFLK